MGEKDEKRASVTVMDSGRGDSPSPEASDTTSECEHFYYDTEEMGKLLAKIESLIDPACEDCWNETAGRRAAGGGKDGPRKQKLEKPNGSIMICSECSGCFCAGLAGRHARRHAKKMAHQVALWIDQPDVAYCFECRHSLSLKAIVDAVRNVTPNVTPGPADGLDYVVRGIPNLGNTCYANALVQCLLVLDKLWMLGPDAPTGSIGVALKELFMETRAGNYAGVMLKPEKLLENVGAFKSKYRGRSMQDSQEFLCHLREGLNEEEKLKRPPNMPEGVPTVVESIFQGQLSTILTSKCCKTDSASDVPFYELRLHLPQMEKAPKPLEVGEFTCSCT